MASPPGGGGGKIRTRRYHINAKPYSKSQPQGILGRVTDSVKSFVPVWLQKYFNKDDDSCPTVSESRLLTERQSANQQIENHVYDVEDSHPRREGRVTPEPVIRHVDEPSTSRTSLLFPDVLTRPSLHRSNLNFSMLDPPTLHCQPSTSSAFPIGSSGFSLVKEIRDSASQHDDDNISTTSGFSSRASDKDVSFSKSVSGPPLWSPEPDRSHSFTQQNTTNLRKPSFNLSAFGSLSPSLANTSQVKSSQLGDSPFYPGKTTYGGAASTRQSKVRTTPYQAPLRRQMKAKQSSTQSYGVTSSTARRILQSLDKMSSPLADARRIPSVASSSLSLTPDRSFLDGTEFQLKKKIDSHPPVQKLLTPKSVSVSINRSVYIKPSLPASQTSKISRRTEENSVSRKRIYTSEQMQEDSDQRFSYPKSSTPAANGLTTGGGGGKMRRERGVHYTKYVQDEEDVAMPELPNISLPISSSAMPSFSIGSLARTTALPFTTVTKPVISMVQPTISFNSSPVFTFSSPIVKSRETSTPPLGSPIGFTFSIPGVKSADLSTPTNKPTSITVSPAEDAAFSSNSSNKDAEQYNGPFKPAKTLKTGSVLDILKSPAFASTRTLATSSVSPVINTSTVAKSEISTFNVGGTPYGTIYKPDTTLWQCDTCLVQNKATDSKCVACSTAKASTLDAVKKTVTPTPSSITKSTPTTTSGFGDKFKPATGSWECDTCLVQNKTEATKCVACETPKPGTGVKPALTLPAHTSTATITSSPSSFPPATNLLGFGDQFKRPPGSWECTVCLVQNKAEDSKCVACLSKKPGESAPVTSSTAFSGSASFGAAMGFGDQFKKPEGTWDCETCLVQNKADRIKCAACESAKPGTKSELKGFGTSVASSTTAVPSFKFGIQSSSEPSSTSGSVGGFKFGDQGGFKIGVTSSDSGASSTTTGGFSFGFPSTNSKSDEPKKDSTLGNSGFTFGLAAGSNNPPSVAPQLSTAGFGQQEKKEPKSTPGGFIFGVGSAATVSSSESSGVFNSKTAEEKTECAVVSFTFGQPSEKKNEAPATLGGFSFGKVEQPKEPVTIAPFVVGRTIDKADSVSASSLPLMFGKQPENEPTKPSLSFGKTDQTKDDLARPTFSFGLTKPAETKDTEPSAKQCLTFGGSTSISDQGAAKPSFSFQSVGSSSTASSNSVATSSGFGSSTSASNPPAATFIFGQASNTSGSSTFGSTNDSKVPQSFIFSSRESKPTTTSSSTGTTAATAPFVFGPAGISSANTATPNTATPNFSFGTTNTSSSTGTTTTPFMFGSAKSAAVAPSFGTTLTNPPAFGTIASAPGFSSGSQPPVAFGAGASSNPVPLFGQQASQPPAFGSGTATSNAGPTFQFGANSGFNFSSSNSSGIFTFGTNAGGPTTQPQTQPQPQPQPPTQSGFGFNQPAATFTLGTNGKNVTNRRIKTAVRRRK